MSVGSLILRAPAGQRTLLKLVRSICPACLCGEKVVVDGVRLEVDLARFPDWDYANGHTDKEEMAFLVDNCPDNGIVLDVGANIGIYSIYVATHRPGARVLAFEPVPEIVERFKRNIALNNVHNIVVCDYALAEEETTKELMLNVTTNTGGNSFVVNQTQFQGFEKKIPVKTKTMLQALQENKVERVDVLKADVEGYEYPILKKFFADAPKSLWPRTMVLEAFGSTIPRVGGSTVELVIASGYHLINHNNMNFFFKL